MGVEGESKSSVLSANLPVSSENLVHRPCPFRKPHPNLGGLFHEHLRIG